MRLLLRPLQGWPDRLRDDDERDYSRFGSTYTGTRDLLLYEAERLDAHEVIVRLAVSEREIIRDGSRLYANIAPEHPGVLVALTLPGGDVLSLHCDLYRDNRRIKGWGDNLRAIALSLEALRALDRWGATQGRQYAGFQALPAGPETGNGQPTPTEAALFIARHSGSTDPSLLANLLITEPAALAAAYRAALKRLHPDHGGDAELFVRLQDAHAVLQRKAAVDG